MDKEESNWSVIHARFSHGTAGLVSIPSALSRNKREKEVFLAKVLITQLNEYSNCAVNVYPNINDADGGHDVIFAYDQNEIGIQLTELTYELLRHREHIRKKYLNEVIALFKANSISSPRKIVISVFLSVIDSDKLKNLRPTQLVTIISEYLQNNCEFRVVPFEFGSILFQPVNEGDIYVSSFGNIGIDINIDNIPTTYETYIKAIDFLVKKKQNSKSPWLLIWSTEFWILRETVGELIVDFLKRSFQKSNFEKVFFLESLDGEGLFQHNLTFYRIKE